MDHRLFIVHQSEIIKLGLATLVKNQLKIEPILVSNTRELKSYYTITDSRLVILADALLNQESFSSAISAFDPSNSIKILLIREQKDNSECKDNCECCFSIMDNKSRICDLIENYIQIKEKTNTDPAGSWLTEREIEVLKLIAMGKTNKEIADELFISIHTVISHRKNITEKLGIKSISGLTVYAILNNLVDASSIDLE